MKVPLRVHQKVNLKVDFSLQEQFTNNNHHSREVFAFELQ